MTDQERADMRRSTATELSVIKRLPALTSLMAMLRVLASLDDEMPIQLVAMLVIVAQRPGVYQRDMDRLLGFSQSSVSRNVHALSRYRRDGSAGFGLVEQRPDARDVRSQRLYLTAAGVAFIARLVDQGAGIAQTEVPPAPARDMFAGTHWEVWVD